MAHRYLLRRCTVLRTAQEEKNPRNNLKHTEFGPCGLCRLMAQGLREHQCPNIL
jgi:hypothetical protein